MDGRRTLAKLRRLVGKWLGNAAHPAAKCRHAAKAAAVVAALHNYLVVLGFAAEKTASVLFRLTGSFVLLQSRLVADLMHISEAALDMYASTLRHRHRKAEAASCPGDCSLELKAAVDKCCQKGSHLSGFWIHKKTPVQPVIAFVIKALKAHPHL